MLDLWTHQQCEIQGWNRLCPEWVMNETEGILGGPDFPRWAECMIDLAVILLL